MARKKIDEVKVELHKRNRNRGRYDLEAMKTSLPELRKYIKPNKYGDPSIDFSSDSAVRILNKAILDHYYQIKYWEFPKHNLCPAIPGRAEYIHAIADLLSESNQGTIPKGKNITCVDIGTGASCIYPIIGVTEYAWNFIGSDIDTNSIRSAVNIIDSNPDLKENITCILQPDATKIFQGIIEKSARIDITICNPPFHSRMKEAIDSNKRKVTNLTGQRSSKSNRNFAGGNTELAYRGGELKFISRMIEESHQFRKQCLWFSSLVSKSYHVNKLQKLISDNKAEDSRILEIRTGNKISRILAWTYHTVEERKLWSNKYWEN